MSRKEYRIQGQKVTEELYKEYYRMDRRRRYLEDDVKAGSIDIDMEKEKVTFNPNKEDSYDRLKDEGVQFENIQAVEDIVFDKATLLILTEALKELDEEEKQIIDSLYYDKLSARKTGEKIGRSHQTVGKKRDKALQKLKKHFNKKGYQDSSFTR
ncbi:sigma factor-like helix-turn-helix DNA-binding protein [Senegalia sp. (in: firmicutes)]|uniref:sigma factor-like helix-turn-helix DNA-binding protein n=1 Tax=Senegalia sp. (in: firmicutes) TaxID=1924098 RepID=UPI003F946476